MKKFIEVVMEWKTYAALMFSGVVILSVVISIIMGENALPLSAIVYMLIFTVIGSFLQFLAFTDRIIKKMRYSSRIILFAIPFFAVLALIAFLFNWFPMDIERWLTFTVIYLIVFIVMIVAFEIYYRAMGKKYDGLLGQYRKQKDNENK